MATQTQGVLATRAASTDLGSGLVALSGLGLVGFGVMFFVRNFTGFVELGLGTENVGVTPEQVQAFSPDFYHYVSHVQVATAGFIIGLGLAVFALAWFGIRSGQRWAVWSAFFAPVVAVAIALPLHYPWGFATIGHLGLVYLDAVILLIGTVLSYRATKA